jgi:hypothetical protein
MDLRAQQAAGEKPLVGLGAIGGVGPHAAGGVVRVDHLGQRRPIVASRIGDPPAPDQAMPAVDAKMVLVAEGRDREVDAGHAFFARLGLGVFDRLARIAILLAQFGWLVRPFRRDAAFLDVALLAVGIALLRRGDNLGVDDLAAHRQKPDCRQRRIEAVKQHFDRRLTHESGPRQRFAEGPDRVGVRHCVGQPQPEKPHERQSVSDQVFGPLVRQIVVRLQDQDFEHQHVIERRPAAFRAIRARHRPLQIRPELVEIDHRVQPLQAVTLGRELLQPLLNVEKSRLPRHCRTPASPTTRNQRSPRNASGF